MRFEAIRWTWGAILLSLWPTPPLLSPHGLPAGQSPIIAPFAQTIPRTLWDEPV
jgi:hypothetical protein